MGKQINCCQNQSHYTTHSTSVYIASKAQQEKDKWNKPLQNKSAQKPDQSSGGGQISHIVDTEMDPINDDKIDQLVHYQIESSRGHYKQNKSPKDQMQNRLALDSSSKNNNRTGHKEVQSLDRLMIKNKEQRTSNQSFENSNYENPNSPRGKGLLQINEMSDEGANSANSCRAGSAPRSRRAGQKPRSSLKMFMGNSNFQKSVGSDGKIKRHTMLALKNESGQRNMNNFMVHPSGTVEIRAKETTLNTSPQQQYYAMSMPSAQPSAIGSFSSAGPKLLDSKLMPKDQMQGSHQKQSLLFPGSESKNMLLSKNDERQALTLTLSDKIKKKLKMDSQFRNLNNNASSFKKQQSKYDRLNYEQAKRQLQTGRGMPAQTPYVDSEFVNKLQSPIKIQCGSGKVPQSLYDQGVSLERSDGSSIERIENRPRVHKFMSMTESIGQSTDRDPETVVGMQLMNFKNSRMNAIEVDAGSNSVSPGIRSQEDTTALDLAAKLQEIQKKVEEFAVIEEENKLLKSEIEGYRSSMGAMKNNMLMNEQIRKIQQQQILNLKGNMRVFCRVKPLDFDDSSADPTSMISFPQKIIGHAESKKISHQTLELAQSKLNNKKLMYNFDQVYLPENSQAEVFKEIKPFVQTALDGMNVCIFAYGQTGTGKTYTMEGPSAEGETLGNAFIDNDFKARREAGILPRTALMLQEEANRCEKQFGKAIRIEVSALEIYCENIRDLLSPQNGHVYLELQAGTGKKVHCLGQTWVPISGPLDFLTQIEMSQSKRIFKNNGANERSSRSHHVFQIRIHTFNKLGKSCTSLLNIVDLAGSERRAGLDEQAGFTSGASNSSLIPARGRRNVSKKGSLRPTNQSPGADIYLSLKQSLKPDVPQIKQSQTTKGTRPRGQSFNVENLDASSDNKRIARHQKRAHGSQYVNLNTSSIREQPQEMTEKSIKVFSANSIGGRSNEISVTNKQTKEKIYDLETESKFINKNLTTLGRIFAILSNRKIQGKVPIPPYRECKLTRLLQNSLQFGDECRTLMIVNICQSKKNCQQSKESLDFAQKAMVAF